MDSKASSLLLLAVFCLLSSTSTAFNITRILANYPNFGEFNNLLSQTGLAQEINSRQTITVLAVANSSIGGLSGKPTDIIKRILSAHVILDYYDQTKLSKLQKKSNILTTLYQTTGIAGDQQGFLNVTRTPNGIMFGSAAKGAPLTASLEGLVTSQPYNISVLQVSGVIEAPGIENMAPPPTPGAAPKKAPAPAPSAKTPVASPAETPAPAAEGPAADEAPTEAPTEAPSDAPADAPASDAPSSDAPANGPSADSTPADAPPPSSGSGLHVSAAAVLVGLVAASAIMRF